MRSLMIMEEKRRNVSSARSIAAVCDLNCLYVYGILQVTIDDSHKPRGIQEQVLNGLTFSNAVVAASLCSQPHAVHCRLDARMGTQHQCSSHLLWMIEALPLTRNIIAYIVVVRKPRNPEDGRRLHA